MTDSSEMHAPTLIAIVSSMVTLAAVITVFTIARLSVGVTVIASCTVLAVGMMLTDHLGCLRGQRDTIVARHDEPELSYGGSE